MPVKVFEAFLRSGESPGNRMLPKPPSRNGALASHAPVGAVRGGPPSGLPPV